MITCPSCQTQYDDDATRFCGRCGSDMRRAVTPSEPGEDPMIGRVVDGRYRVVGKIGHGGMGAVYRVEHLAMGKQAAMKLLHPALSADVEIGRRFRREAEAVSRLSHPNTVQVFDFGEQAGFMYLVMELVRGEDLGQIVRRDGPLSWERTQPILMQVCDALSEAHEAGVIHRDLKPENLLVTRARDGHDVVKVLDFGLAKLRDAEELNQVTARGSLIGTPFYMSPEQIRGEDLDARSDLYSLGAVTYRLLTGQHPFTAPTPVAVLTQHLTEPLELPSRRRPDLALPRGIDEIVARTMAKDRDARFGSADELRAAIAAVKPRTGAPDSGPMPPLKRATDASHSPTEPQLRREDFDAYERGLRRRRWLGLSAMPLALLLAGGGAWLYQRSQTPQAGDIENEPNNNAAQANWIASDHTIKGHIGARMAAEESDRDFYQLTIAAGPQVLHVAITGLPTMDLKLEVFDAHAQKIAETDAGEVGDGEVLPNVRLAAGDYYLAVREVWVAGRVATEDLINWYTLTARWHPLARDEESEPDDSPAQAVALTLDEPMRGYLGRLGDVDYYYPTGEGGGTLSAQLSAIEGVDTRLIVLPAGATVGPPGALPAGARVFDTGGPGVPEQLDGIAWDPLKAGPIIVVERKDPKPDAAGRRAPLVGLDVPYSLTARLAKK